MSTYGNMIGSPMGLLDDLDRRLTNIENIITAPSNGPTQVVIQPAPNSPPGTMPVVIAPVVSPPTNVVVKTGALYGNIYADIIWVTPVDGTAIAFEVAWAVKNPDGTLGLPGAARVGGNQYRINNLLPNTTYEATVSSVNILGQMARYPIDGSFVLFATGTDQTIPPAVSNVVLAEGATSVIVKFDPLTFQQAPDVANGNGVYQVDISNDPTFANVFRSVRSTAFVVAFNDVYPHTTLASAITAQQGTSFTAAPPPGSGVTPIMTGTFIQESPTIDTWTGSRWDEEMTDMDAVGIKTLILQWSLDEDDQKVLYPGPPVPNIPGTSTPYLIGPDYVDNLLFHANAHGDQVWLGLSNFGAWQSHAGDATWLGQQLALSEQVADELYSLFGSNAAFVGWYIPFEIDALLLSTPADITPMTNYFTSLINYLHTHYPSKLVMVSPTYSINGVLLSPTSYATALKPVVAGVDVINLQDGGSTQTPATISSYFAALKTALTGTGTALWSNPDMFGTSGPMPSAQLQANIQAAAPYVSKITGFSFPTQMGPHDISSSAYDNYKTYALKEGLPVQLTSTDGFSTSSNYNAMVDQEMITFVPGTGNTAFIAARNQGTNAPAWGPVAHAVGAPVSVQTGVTWYARVAPIDNSGNQGPWAFSGQPLTGQGVNDSMIVGDMSAAHITFGTMKGDRIETNSLSANTITSSFISSANIQLAGGSFYAGSPPNTGLIINSQGLRLYNNGVLSVALDTYSGTGYFSGTVSASTINASTISGGNISGATISGNTITGGTISAATISGGTITGTTISGSTLSGNTISGQTISGGTITSATINTSNINTATINGSTYNNGSTNNTTHYTPTFQDVFVNANTGTSDSNLNFKALGRVGLFYGLLGHLALGLVINTNPGDVYIGGNFSAIAAVCSSLQTIGNSAGSGDLIVGGSFSASGAKSFRIKHPVPSQQHKDLLYFSTESPKSDLIYRGKATTTNHTAIVDLDRVYKCSIGTFAMLTRKSTRQVFLFNETSGAHASYALNHGVLTITTDTPSDTVGWLVVAERGDDKVFIGNVVDSDGDLVNEVEPRPALVSSAS